MYGNTVARISEFFQPPPSLPPEETARYHRPARSARPHGTPPAVVATELLLARSPTAAIYIAYLDAYPTGFEFEVKAITSTAAGEFALDVFGRHWPMVGEKRDELPPQLLRIGVQFADGRKATNIAGPGRSPAGPTMWPLAGGGGGAGFHQRYWVSPLPPSGPVALVCEWPAAGIPLARHEVDAELILDAAATVPDEELTRLRDGHEWRIGTDAEVAWIDHGTSQGTAITAAIPPLFADYCTLELPTNWEEDQRRHDRAVIARLTEHSEEQPWWLGYLDTGADDVVFPDAPPALLYGGWNYVLVEAGPQQAATWRHSDAATFWKGALPNLMFPADRSWLVSTLWDDDWSCIGGPRRLVDSLLLDPDLGSHTRRVALGQDATPPGHSTN